MGQNSYDEKLLVVVNPWPPSGAKHPQFINNVSTWFELMLRVDHPHACLKVEAIYQQKTHPNIIVELPAEAKIEHLLGAHHWDRILREPYGSKFRGEVSYVYEYKYDTFRHPSRINWYAGIPTYKTVDATFPILFPYPLPGLAPAPRLVYAAILPKHLRSDINPTTQISSFHEQFKKDPIAVTARDTTKEESLKVLQSLGESNSERVRVKLEPTTDDYEPSPELVAMLSHVQPDDTRKHQPQVTRIKHEEDYNPSEELQAAILAFGSPRTEKRVIQVKQEPEEPEKSNRHRRWRSNDDEPVAKRLKPS